MHTSNYSPSDLETNIIYNPMGSPKKSFPYVLNTLFYSKDEHKGFKCKSYDLNAIPIQLHLFKKPENIVLK